MMSLITISKAQSLLAENMRTKRLQMGLTQEGLAKRAGISLRTLRKFEQEGLISLESYLKLLMVLDKLDSIIEATKPGEKEFDSIDDVLKAEKKKIRLKGWRK